MNRDIYFASKKIQKPNYIATGIEFIYYNPVAKKADMKYPIKIVFTSVEVEDGVVIGGVYELAVPKSKHLNRHMLAKTNLDLSVFRLEDEQKCNALFCKAMLYYAPSRIKKKDQKFIDEFTEKHPELMV